VVAFEVSGDGKSLKTPGRVFTTPLESGVIPDGLCCDTAGSLFVTTAIGV
jgi:sugar lactone lactonase YvrE